MSLRRGYLLAEAVAALALAGVLAATAAMALGGARKALLSGERRDRAERAERASVAALRDALTTGEFVAVAGDTAVDVDLTALLGVVCATGAHSLVLPPVGAAAPHALTVQAQSIDVDDVVSVLVPDGAWGAWWSTTLDSVATATDAAGCGSADGWSTVGDDPLPRLTLVLRDSLPEAVTPGMTVRVGRPGRFTLYHAGSGDWMLGWRRCSAVSGVCGVVQPVSGPLRTPAAGGLRISERADPAQLDLLVTGADGGRSVRATIHQ